jgi:hypothetical protein
VGEVLFGHHPAGAGPGFLFIGFGQAKAHQPEPSQDLVGDIGVFGFHCDLL